LISADSRREKLLMRILVAIFVPGCLFLAVLIIVVADEPWF
jgi:hypothetical protein